MPVWTATPSRVPDGCVMCLGEVAQVRAVSPGGLVVDSGARTATVSALLLDGPPSIGDWVVTHAGFALATISEDEARDALDLRARQEAQIDENTL